MKTKSADYYTRSNVNVTKRIEDGKTFAFKSLKEAEEKARQIGSYVYELLELIDGKLIPYGYAVPK